MFICSGEWRKCLNPIHLPPLDQFLLCTPDSIRVFCTLCCFVMQSCHINDRSDCHVAILLQIKGLRYFVDVANAKPYTRAVQLGDTTVNSCLGGSFQWTLAYSSESDMMQVRHVNGTQDTVAVEFHPASTVQYSSFYEMIRKSRSNVSFGPFLTGLRLCLYPNNATEIVAVRDASIYHGDSMNCKRCASCTNDLVTIAKSDAFSHIKGFDGLVQNAVDVLDRSHPEWFGKSCTALASKGIAS